MHQGFLRAACLERLTAGRGQGTFESHLGWTRLLCDAGRKVKRLG